MMLQVKVAISLYCIWICLLLYEDFIHEVCACMTDVASRSTENAAKTDQCLMLAET